MKRVCEFYRSSMWVEFLDLIESKFHSEISYIVMKDVRNKITMFNWNQLWEKMNEKYL